VRGRKNESSVGGGRGRNGESSTEETAGTRKKINTVLRPARSAAVFIKFFNWTLFRAPDIPNPYRNIAGRSRCYRIHDMHVHNARRIMGTPTLHNE